MSADVQQIDQPVSRFHMPSLPFATATEEEEIRQLPHGKFERRVAGEVFERFTKPAWTGSVSS